MMLKVGELAKRAGLTVRALHHYDAIGLLAPSGRSESGYRLYNRSDIARLHQIQALRRFGVALADIGTFLASPNGDLGKIVEQQIGALTRQIDQATALRSQLGQLQRQLNLGEEPELGTWLTTLEMMTMYDRYFSKEELKRLPFFDGDAACLAEWKTLVASIAALQQAGVDPADPRAAQLALHWMIMIERDTDASPDLFVRLNAMHANEPLLREQNGITPQLQDYVVRAFSIARMALYEKYLSPAEFEFMQANYMKRAHEWPALIARVRKAVDAGMAPTDPAARDLALRWFELFRSYAGDDPATHQKIRAAHQKEPRFMTGTFITEDLLAFIGPAMAALRAPPC
ncbi:MAG: MerR family transcriptional regulator [Pseudomonadota bacterium]